ncbi:MAG: hypothetical protein JWO30_4337 [Fibrobacteres bacterium]|nr:hypothetical protein [Fibrobacterota bacterium]
MTPPKASGPARSKTLITAFYRGDSDSRSSSQVTEEEGKFVVLTKGKGIHLVLSPVTLTPYHANIVYQYLQVEGRGDVEAVSSSGCHILSKEWKVHGGGYYTVQHWLHNLILHGKSTAFGKYDKSLLARFMEEIPERLDLAAYTLEFK